ncbi:MAG: ribonuclease HIII, partial [Bacilli bacterium]|nr:ribonuclease HIII [Bacilli bacterium]
MNRVIKVSDETINKMIEYYKDKLREKTPPYAIFQAEEEDTVVTLYESGKAMFQGTSADVDANMWQDMDNHLRGQSLDKENDYYYVNAIGSDEVGTGDYFGPIVVSAAYVNKKDIKFLEELGIRDSKKITDDIILEIVPKLIKRIKYASVILNNKEYNDKYSNEVNMNKIKAILHNKVLSNVLTNKLEYDYIIVDKFVSEDNYYKYLKESIKPVKKITFLTKAEDKNLSVACASVISRYIFIKEFDKLSDQLKIKLPKGAGKIVDEIGKEIVTKYGSQKLKEISKYNFKNT